MRTLALAAILVVAAACGPVLGIKTEEPPSIIGHPVGQPTETQDAIAAFVEVTNRTTQQTASLDRLPRGRHPNGRGLFEGS